MLAEERGDLLSAGDGYLLAHCISRDCRLGKGVAKVIDDAYRVRAALLGDRFNYSKEKVAIVEAPLGGGKAILIANMVTKERYWQKPTYESLREALQELREKMASLGLRKVAMPRIGCGLDCLSWEKVRRMVADVFAGSQVEVKVYYL